MQASGRNSLFRRADIGELWAALGPPFFASSPPLQTISLDKAAETIYSSP
jgi:hypothetical protein